MTTLWSVLVPLAQKPPNPNNVVAGWLGAVVLLALAGAVVVLGFSLRKHLGKVNFDDGSSKPEQPKSEPKREPGNGNGQASHAPSS
jgi:hypothetical protein